jgi:hypothetical protein
VSGTGPAEKNGRDGQCPESHASDCSLGPG